MDVIFQGRKYSHGDKIRLTENNIFCFGEVLFGTYNTNMEYEHLGFYVDYKNEMCTKNQFFRESLPYVINHMFGVLV
jgi:hypothetical protein